MSKHVRSYSDITDIGGINSHVDDNNIESNVIPIIPQSNNSTMDSEKELLNLKVGDYDLAVEIIETGESFFVFK